MALGPSLLDQPSLLEQPQVAGYGRPSHWKLGGNFSGIAGRDPEHVEDLAPDGIGEGSEFGLQRFCHLTY
jgi:hypothetical protein